ncbi:hypothetical protein Trydic_g15780 [Trypoxylus dichotomus]
MKLRWSIANSVKHPVDVPLRHDRGISHTMNDVIVRTNVFIHNVLSLDAIDSVGSMSALTSTVDAIASPYSTENCSVLCYGNMRSKSSFSGSYWIAGGNSNTDMKTTAIFAVSGELHDLMVIAPV